MKQLITILISLLPLIINCQSIDYQKIWIDSIESIRDHERELKKENEIKKYQVFDFTSLFYPHQDFLGFIGKDYSRIKIYFQTIIKDTSNQSLYHVIGSTIVKGNKCDFSGTIEILKILEYKHLHLGVDSTYFGKCKSQGILLSKYLFKENPNQKHVGIFEGIMTLTWFTDNYNILHYDDIEWFSDSYRNNQYVGTWTEYNSKISQVCNWGVSRIPFSGDLDIGTGEFSPNSKYLNNGWKDLEIK